MPASNVRCAAETHLEGMRSALVESIGRERLQRVTEWARDARIRLVLGEFGAGADDVCEAAVTDMLEYVHANSDVSAGWAWWAAGPWWGSYFLDRTGQRF
jgi:endoglucanase